MHLIIMADTFEEHLPKFEGWCCNRQYKDKKGRMWKISPRRIQLYDLIIPKDIEKEVVRDIRAFENGMMEGKLKWLRRLLRLGGMKSPDMSLEKFNANVTPNKGDVGRHLGWWTHINVIGKMEDPKHEDGSEYL